MAIRIMRILVLSACIITNMTAEKVFAAHPLITDDTGTQGEGTLQIEVVGEFGKDSADGTTVKSLEFPTIPFISYGISDTMDIVFGISYASLTVDDGFSKNAVHGITDASFELKKRMYEKAGFSVAVKPGISIPSGDENKGMGNGRASLALTLITTLNAELQAYHLNLGYARNEFKHPVDKAANRRDIWHASIAAEAAVLKDLVVVGNIGIERNPDKTSDTHPAFVLGGIVYSLRDDLDVDFGVKGGISSPETDLSLLAGIAWRY